MGDREFVNHCNDVILSIYQTALDHGWHNNPDAEHLAIKIALIHSELSEALEELRVGNSESEHIPGFSRFEEEGADAVIRIFDMAGHDDLNIAEAIVAKAEYNKNRPYRHGNKKF